MNGEARSDAVGLLLMELYVDWREASAALEKAYRRWSSAPEPDRALTFAAYRAALDREELASILYWNQYQRTRAELGGSFSVSRQ